MEDKEHVWPPPPERTPEAEVVEPRTEPAHLEVSSRLPGLISVCLGMAGWVLLGGALLFHVPLYPLKSIMLLLSVGGLWAGLGKSRLSHDGQMISLTLFIACLVIDVLHIAREL